jgi:hypothetical protein
MKPSVLFLLGIAPLCLAGAPEYFTPAHRVSGIGAEREKLSSELLEMRTHLMVQSQTFGIMRDPMSLTGAKRVTSGKLQSLIRSAAARS